MDTESATKENVVVDEKQVQGDDTTELESGVEQTKQQLYVIVNVITPLGESINIGPVSLLENTNYLKQAMYDLFETSYYTNFSLEYRSISGQKVVLNDFVELNAYMSEEAKSTVTLRMVPHNYDIKSARNHVKRSREVLLFPPLTKGIFTGAEDTEIAKSSASPETMEETKEDEEKHAAEVAAEIQRMAAALPNEKDIFGGSAVTLQDYYEEVLYRVSKSETPHLSKFPADAIRYISYSGWNPAPPARRLRGDLFYLEVHFSNPSTPVLHITAQTAGFYVNRSTLAVFDPSPAAEANFSHELLHTLFASSEALCKGWSAASDHIDSLNITDESSSTLDKLMIAPPNALESVAAFYDRGKGDNVTQVPQWTVQSSVNIPDVSTKKTYKGDISNSYDMSRAQDDLADSFGMEDKGAPRDWNEEIQSIRAVKTKDMSEYLMKQRYAYRIIQEFQESCRIGTVAISQGHVTAVNPMDTEECQVFVFNNIFFSRTVDVRETFKVCEGNDACRKSAGQDLKCQKLIQNLGVTGLNTVLTAVIDYKGQRWLGQSVIPGILQTGESAARLMYGILEDGGRLKCKSEALEIMKELGKKLDLAERTIPAVPEPLPGANPPNKEDPNTVMLGFLASGDSQQDKVIRVDDDGEVFPLDSPTISHIGPIEGKLIRGSDGRVYVLEMARLTPRDANYVKGEKGTGNIEYSKLCKVDDNICIVYSLRDELIRTFRQDSTMKLRQAEMVKLLEKINLEKQEEKQSDNKELENGEPKSECNEVASAGSSESDSKCKTAVADAEAVFSPEVMRRLQSIQTEFKINPNCFLQNPCDVDASVAEADEKFARELADFLFKTILPMVTELIRLGEDKPLDGKALTDYLHGHGVNMRYLGELCMRARTEEAIEMENLKNKQKRKNPMPLFWLELLEVEIIARCMKHIVNDILASNSALRAAPANVLSHLLNLLLGTGEGAVPLSVTESLSLIESQNKKKKAKKGGKASSTAFGVTDTLPFNSAFNMTKVQFWKAYTCVAESKFLYTHALILENEPDSNAFKKNGPFTMSFRLSKLAILRRVCQLSGIRIVCKNYDFSSPAPFGESDVQDMFPIVKSCEPENPVPEAKYFLEESKAFLQQGNVAAAFERAQDASRFVSQVVGPVHRDCSRALEVMSQVLLHVGDNKAAVSSLSKKLTIDVQLQGLDSADTIQNHLCLSSVYQELGNYVAAAAHVRTAMYIMKLCCGEEHPDISIVYLRLSGIYYSVGKFDVAFSCLYKAKLLVDRNGDQGTHALICQNMADIYSQQENYKDAITLQKQCYVITRQLFGESDPRTAEAKSRFEVLIRKSAQRNEEQMKEKTERQNVENEKSKTMWLDDSFRSKPVKKAKGKKGKKK